MAWTYSDYVTFDAGAARLTRFRLHLAEVSDKLSPEMTETGSAYSTREIREYLKILQAAAPKETATCKAVAGTRSVFTRGKAKL